MGHTESDSGWRGRLAEMEEELHALAAELAADAGEPAPEPVAPEPVAADSVAPAAVAPEAVAPARPSGPPPPARPASPPPPARPQAARPPDPTLEAMCERLLASMRELMAGYELALTHVAARPDAGALTVAAGPFVGLATLERFESALRGLPEVADVAVREYEGSDRVVLEVRLA